MLIKGTREKSAEMVTDEGAIYVTSNMGYNWKAAVEETVSATLNRCLVLKTKLCSSFFRNRLGLSHCFYCHGKWKGLMNLILQTRGFMLLPQLKTFRASLVFQSGFVHASGEASGLFLVNCNARSF